MLSIKESREQRRKLTVWVVSSYKYNVTHLSPRPNLYKEQSVYNNIVHVYICRNSLLDPNHNIILITAIFYED